MPDSESIERVPISSDKFSDMLAEHKHVSPSIVILFNGNKPLSCHSDKFVPAAFHYRY